MPQADNGTDIRILTREQLLEQANALPLCPGVYLMRDRTGQVIYVGKSRKLKNRVSQYFQNGEKNIKTDRMVRAVASFDYFICKTEIEALTLENSLIKQYTPRYNIKLKDAKSYPYIKITEGEYPSIVMTRKRSNDRGRYFGPYSGTATVFSVLDMLQKTLRLPACRRKFPRDIGKERPCLYEQMGRCCGVCTGKVSPEEYATLIGAAERVLQGNIAAVRKQTEEQMMAYAEAERYEAAARCRDTVRALDALRQKQTVVAAPDTEQDVVGVYSDEFGSCISVFYIRSGAVTDKADFHFGREQIADESSIVSFLCEHYRVRTYLPPTVLLSFPLEEEEQMLLAGYLTSLAGHRVKVHTPMRGDLRTLCDTVAQNAKESAARQAERLRRDDGVLSRLAQLCGLPEAPQRIEAYDISNLGSEHLTAGMVVWEDGKFARSDYRTFHIRSVVGTTDDYASMREALCRRLSHLKDAEGSFAARPDLILLDGGRRHVGVIRALLSEMDLDIPVFGMVKDDYHKTRALCTDTEEISVAREQAVFMLLYRIQEEVHRYTVSRMEGAKRKTLKTSSLEKIPGIGPAKAKALLKHFGTLGALKTADREALLQVKGISARDAESVWTYYHDE
ncbi:MAG: excinuclease ABC subunit UvrC [Clostridia bacterium]|nr:excinuclease ABC subunit UvrC [Clostridia bacterium]